MNLSRASSVLSFRNVSRSSLVIIVNDVPLQPVAIVLFQFWFFLAKTDSAACEEDGRKKHDCSAGKNPEAARAVHAAALQRYPFNTDDPSQNSLLELPVPNRRAAHACENCLE